MLTTLRAVLVVAAVASASCSSMPRQSDAVRNSRPLPESLAPALPQAAMLVNVSQASIVADEQISILGPGFGLAIVLLNVAYEESINRDANASLAPIRSALSTENVPARLDHAIQKAVAAVQPNLRAPTRLVSARTSDELNRQIVDLPAPSALVVDVRYSMSPDAKYLTLQTFVMLIPKDPDLRRAQANHFPKSAGAATAGREAFTNPENSSYFNRFSYTVKLDDTGHPDALRAVWLKDGAKKLRDGLDEAATGTAMMMLVDLRLASAKTLASGNSERFEMTVGGKSVEVGREADGGLVAITS